MWFWYFAVFLRAYCCIMISFISTFVLGPNADILNYRRRQFLVSYQNYAFSSFWCSAMPAFLTTLSELETVCKVQKSLYLYTYVNGICRLNKSYTSAIWVFMSTKWDVYDVPLNDDICCFSSLSRIFTHKERSPLPEKDCKLWPTCILGSIEQ